MSLADSFMSRGMMDKYASVIVALMELAQDDVVQIRSLDPLVTWPFALALEKHVTLAGGHVIWRIQDDREKFDLFVYGTPAQYTRLDPVAMYAIAGITDEQGRMIAPPVITADIAIAGQERSNHLAMVSPEAIAARKKAWAPWSAAMNSRIAAGDLKSMVVTFPSPAGAKPLGMTVQQYAEFIVTAGALHKTDPAAYWLSFRDEQQRTVDALNSFPGKKVKITGPNIDLTFSMQGNLWINSYGEMNFPPAEVFTAPLANTVTGSIQFDYPVYLNDVEVCGVWVVIEDGKLINFGCDSGYEQLSGFFNTPGAAQLGEWGIGTNPHISPDNPAFNFGKLSSFLKEKAGGTLHFAWGYSHERCLGYGNVGVKSGVHEDFILSGRDVAAEIDDVLIYEDGQFLV